MLEFPKSNFYPDLLKEHLRDNLKDMKSGVNNPEEGEAAVVQDEDLMNKLMNIDSWKVHNILKLRDGFMQGKESPQFASSLDKKDSRVSLGHSTGADTHPPTPLGSKDTHASGKLATKSQNLKWVGDDISSMLTKFKHMQEDKRADLSHKRLHVESKEKLNEAKVKELRGKNL